VFAQRLHPPTQWRSRQSGRAGWSIVRAWSDFKDIGVVSSLGRRDEADDLILLQFFHDIGEFALRNAGHRNAHFIESTGHRAGGYRQLVRLKEFGDVVG